MDAPEITLRIVAGIALILANGFFVAIEFSLTRTRQFTEAEFVEPGSRGLERAWEMTQNLELYLTTCQVGITASSIAVGIIAEPALAALFEPVFENTLLASIGSGGILAFLIINLVHLTHGEQTPTYLGVERSRFVAKYGAIPLYWFHYLISPVIALGDGVAKLTLKLFGVEMTGAWLEGDGDIDTREDLRSELASILARGGLAEERRQEIMNALRVGERPVREVMTPNEDIRPLRITDNPEINLERIAENPHTKYPLVGETLSDFRGIVYARTLFEDREALNSGEIDFEKIAAPPMTLSPDADVSDAIDQFQTENQELALVIEDGNVVGLVTVTDLLESIMGDIEDPVDVGPE